MSTSISADELTWNSASDMDQAAGHTCSDVVKVTTSGEDAQYLFVFRTTANNNIDIEAQTGNLWMAGQGTMSTRLTASGDTNLVQAVVGPLESARFKESNTITFNVTDNAAGTATKKTYMHALKVPK